MSNIEPASEAPAPVVRPVAEGDEASGGASGPHREQHFAGIVMAVLGAMILLAGLDLFIDLGEGTTPLHVITEALVIACGLFGVGLMVRRLRALTRQAGDLAREAARLSQRLQDSQEEAARWRREAGALLRGLGAAIDGQFERWRLSRAEREVALLLLKGLSHKEIAAARGVGVATVRQQAQAVYRKAGVSGRSDLAAFFLEDLLLPPGDTSTDR